MVLLESKYEIVRADAAAGVALVRSPTGFKTRWIEWPLESTTGIDDLERNNSVIDVEGINVVSNKPSTHFLHSDFGGNLEFLVNARSSEIEAQNLVVFLHGRGDSHVPFARLGEQMALPQTATVSLRAPIELPFDLGYAWYNDFDDEYNLIPPHVSHARVSASLESARNGVWSFLTTIRDVYHWPLERVFLFGFSQGANVAFHLTMTLPCRLGGVVLVAGGSICGSHVSPNYNSRTDFETPLLLLCGEKDEQYPPAMAVKTERQFIAKYGISLINKYVSPSKRHGMVQSRHEMLPIMQFFSKYLYLRNIALESQSDVIEIRTQSRKK